MSGNYKRYRNRDNCPRCGVQYFICTNFYRGGEIYLHQQQCPKCNDFFTAYIDGDNISYSGQVLIF